MLLEILSQVKIDELIEEPGHKVYISCHIIVISAPLNLFGSELGDVQYCHLLRALPYDCQLHPTELVYSRARICTVAPPIQINFEWKL
jgi:hypothetical protein